MSASTRPAVWSSQPAAPGRTPLIRAALRITVAGAPVGSAPIWLPDVWVVASGVAPGIGGGGPSSGEAIRCQVRPSSVEAHRAVWPSGLIRAAPRRKATSNRDRPPSRDCRQIVVADTTSLRIAGYGFR